jgi:hypothetical protein
MPARQRSKRGTRAQLNAAAAANALLAGEPYLITDEGRPAVGTGVGTYAAVALQSELPAAKDYGLITSSPTATEDWGGL